MTTTWMTITEMDDTRWLMRTMTTTTIVMMMIMMLTTTLMMMSDSWFTCAFFLRRT